LLVSSSSRSIEKGSEVAAEVTAEGVVDAAAEVMAVVVGGFTDEVFRLAARRGLARTFLVVRRRYIS